MCTRTSALLVADGALAELPRGQHRVEVQPPVDEALAHADTFAVEAALAERLEQFWREP
jgi:hypothetical protein